MVKKLVDAAVEVGKEFNAYVLTMDTDIKVEDKEFANLVKSLGSVSYTHLDVYKRQVNNGNTDCTVGRSFPEMDIEKVVFHAPVSYTHLDVYKRQRLSREDGDKVESNSIASQRAICEDYIARHEDLDYPYSPRRAEPDSSYSRLPNQKVKADLPHP